MKQHSTTQPATKEDVGYAATAERYTLCATFPRSGHNLMVEALLRLCGRTNSSVEEHKGMIRSGRVVYCEHYTHCGRIPCSNATTNIQKTHDFDLKVVVPSGASVLVQFRTPVESIVSYYRRARSRGNAVDSLMGWRRFAARATLYWKGFISKWAVGGSSAPGDIQSLKPLCVSYHDLLTNPARCLSDVYTLMFAETAPDFERLTAALRRLDVRPRHRIENFDYYDRSHFDAIECQCRELMLELRLPSYAV